MNGNGFAMSFEALMGFAPFPWQRRLYERIMSGDWPEALDIPTGLGKTSVIAIWLIALAEGGDVPRRLVYVVNRRTIVDQATRVVERLREKLRPGNAPDLQSIRDRLACLADDPKNVLGISTLRGALADNQQWRRHPARASIVVGTVDMIGSRLLFRGYRDSWKVRPTSAGLLGRDTLLVHDEAHLTPAFQSLLDRIQTFQANEPTRNLPPRLRVLQLSATRRSNAAEPDKTQTLTHEDREHDRVQQIVRAKKTLHIQEADLRKRKLPDELTAIALSHREGTVRVLIYVTRPAEAEATRRKLAAEVGEERVELLTGTIRGHERDLLAEQPILRHLMDSESPELTEYLVATSAGEVGVDLDADHMVCDLTTLDSMIQRLGRVNRRGNGDARVDVVVEKGLPAKKDPLGPQRTATRAALWPGAAIEADGSPKALRELVERLSPEQRAAAFAPPPVEVELQEPVMDAWTLTSIRATWPLAQPVAPYLHGLEDDLPRTTVAWRAELDDISESLWRYEPRKVSRLIGRVLERYRLRPQETLTESPYNVAALLEAIGKRDDEQTAARYRWCIVVRGGETQVLPLTELDDTKRFTRMLAEATVVLPTKAGGRRPSGMIDPAQVSLVPDPDVADWSDEDKLVPPRRRAWLERDEDQQWHWRVMGGDQATESAERWSKARQALLEHLDSVGLRLRVTERLEFDEDAEGCPTRMLLLLGPLSRRKKPTDEVLLTDHTADVERAVEQFGRGLLPDSLALVFAAAATHHDTGKVRERWQQAVYNPELGCNAKAWGKPGRRGMNGRLLAGYRHEFGSLRDLVGSPDLDAFSAGDRDLLLHLIACHHGYARPHFGDRAMVDPDAPTAAVPELLTPGEIARRFDRLQRRYGRWGLAWLEAVFRAADAWASGAADEDDTEDDTPEEPTP